MTTVKPPRSVTADSTPRDGRGSNRRGIKRPWAWPFALPAFIAIALILLYPLGYNIWISLHVDNLSKDDGAFVGLANYWAAVTSGDLLGTVGRTIFFTVGSLVLQFVVGLSAALALEFFPRASKVIRPILLTPWVMPGVAVAAVWLAILNPFGLVNRLLGIVGVAPVGWLTTPTLAMLSLIVVNAWKGSPYWIIMISAGLKTIPAESLEAARVDGASYFQILWSVIFPALRPILSVTSVLAFIWTFNYFDLAYLLTNGGPDGATTTLPFAIFQDGIKFYRFDQGAAFSVLSVVLTGIAIVIYLRLTRKQKETL